jgi:hypothetical protein
MIVTQLQFEDTEIVEIAATHSYSIMIRDTVRGDYLMASENRKKNKFSIAAEDGPIPCGGVADFLKAKRMIIDLCKERIKKCQ